MPTREALFEATRSRGIRDEESRPTIDAICNVFGGENGHFPVPPDRQDLRHRNGKIVALWVKGKTIQALASRFGLSESQIRKIVNGFVSRN